MMNYKLQENEEVRLEIKPHGLSVWYFVLASMGRFLHLIIMFLLVVLMSFISHYFNSEYGSSWSIFSFIAERIGLKTETIMMLSLGLLVLIFLGLFGLSKLVVNAYTYTITNQRIIIRYGLITLNQRIIPFSQINDINMQSSILERIFGLGSIYLDTITTNLNNFYRRRSSNIMNNTGRLEGLTHQDCDEVMNIISAHIQKLKTNQSV
jgi:uncharacterized membrane protein YdbT with pleckstrin-like domain